MTKSSFYHDGWRDYERHNPLSYPDEGTASLEYIRGWTEACNLHLAAQDLLAFAEEFLAWDGTPGDEADSPLAAQARAAILKAKGA